MLFSGADLCRVLVEAEHAAMEEIMSTIVGDAAQPPVAVVHQHHLDTVLQRLTPSVKVPLLCPVELLDCQRCEYPLSSTTTEWLGSRVVSVLDSGAVGSGFKSQPRRCRVTVLGKLFTPIMPMFTKQRNW